jgi:hypothetical protein
VFVVGINIRYSHGLVEEYLLHVSFKIGETATVTQEMVRTAHADHSMDEVEWQARFKQAEISREDV